eukprot:Sdes_comp18128_c0_seq1m7593
MDSNFLETNVGSFLCKIRNQFIRIRKTLYGENFPAGEKTLEEYNFEFSFKKQTQQTKLLNSQPKEVEREETLVSPHCHSFSVVNFHKEKQEFLSSIEFIKERIEDYKKCLEAELPVSKLQTYLKDRLQIYQSFHRFKTSLLRHSEIIRESDVCNRKFVLKHLLPFHHSVQEGGKSDDVSLFSGSKVSSLARSVEFRGSPILTENEKNLSALLLRLSFLKRIANHLNLQYHADISEEFGVGISTTLDNLTVSLSSLGSGMHESLVLRDLSCCVFINDTMFYLEIILFGSGEVAEVKISHTFNERDDGLPQHDPLLTKLLAAFQYDLFVEHLCRIQQLYSVARSGFPPGSNRRRAQMYSLLLRFQKDYQLISLLEYADFFRADLLDCLRKGHGLYFPRCGGNYATLTFFAAPFVLTKMRLVLAGKSMDDKKKIISESNFCDASCQRFFSPSDSQKSALFADPKYAARQEDESVFLERCYLSQFGVSCSVEIEESSSECHLFTKPLVDIAQSRKSRRVSFFPLDEMMKDAENFVSGPFRFVLKLKDPLPASFSLVQNLFSAILCGGPKDDFDACKPMSDFSESFSSFFQSAP